MAASLRLWICAPKGGLCFACLACWLHPLGCQMPALESHSQVCCQQVLFAKQQSCTYHKIGHNCMLQSISLSAPHDMETHSNTMNQPCLVLECAQTAATTKSQGLFVLAGPWRNTHDKGQEVGCRWSQTMGGQRMGWVGW